MPRALLATVLILVSPAFLIAQETRGATIAGTVRDSAARPIADADIIARPGNHRARSDSAGTFVVTGLDGGSYIVVARKLGYAPEQWDVKLSKSGRVELKFVLGRRVQLDTVVVRASRDCPEFTLDAFFCHRSAGGGLFLDYPDIDEKETTLTGDLFRGIPGFRVTLRSTRSGRLVPVPVAHGGFGCIVSLVDGRPPSPANPIPSRTMDLSALEVYTKPDSVPAAYRRYTWPSGDVTGTGRCSVVVYWTIWAPLGR